MLSRIIIGVVLAALVAGGGYWASRPPTVEIIRAEAGPVSQRLVATGRVSSDRRVNLGSVSVGTVAEVRVEAGDVVQAGDLLVRLEDADARAAVRLAEANLVQARANVDQLVQVGRPEAATSAVKAETDLNQAQRELERARQLRRDGFLSDADWEARQDAVELARARLDSARQTLASRRDGGSDWRRLTAQVTAAEASLDQARAALDHTRLTAPIDARVLQRSVDAGDVVQPGVALLALAGERLDRIELALNEQQAGRVALGQSARVSVDAYPDRSFAAAVSFIGARIDPERAVLPVRLRAADPPDYLKADMTASVDIAVARTSASVTLPTTVILYPEPDRPAVMVLTGGRIVQRELTLGLRGDDRVEVREGLAPDDRVVLEPERVTPGQRAAPREAAQP